MTNLLKAANANAHTARREGFPLTEEENAEMLKVIGAGYAHWCDNEDWTANFTSTSGWIRSIRDGVLVTADGARWTPDEWASRNDAAAESDNDNDADK